MTVAARQAVSRRALLRGTLARKDDAAPAQWLPVDGLAGGAGDVLWTGWSDGSGTFVAGDDGVILHLGTTGWSREDCPVPVPIHALWGRSRDDLWAVGWMGLILNRDAGGWRKVRGCIRDEGGKYATCAENTPLFAISGRADGTAWAVGDRGAILHFDGSEWQPEAAGLRAHLRAVACLADGRILAAGGDGAVLIREPEGTWRRLDNPHRSNFTAALPLDDGSVLLAGGRYFVDANGFRGDLVLMRGTGFERLHADAAFTRFRALGRLGADTIAVGDGGRIHRLRDGRIDRLESGTAHDLLGIVAQPSGAALAVGDFGTVLACDAPARSAHAAPATAVREAPAWQAEQSGTDRQLWGLWRDPASGLTHACGEEGTVLVRDRGRWERLPPVSDLGIHALNRAPDGALLAAGQLGEVHRFDGTAWRAEFDLHMDITILSLWSDSMGRVMAAGDEGLVLQRDEGGAWTRMPSGTKSALYGLWGMDARHVLAVGDFGLVLRWNGTRWDQFAAGTDHFLFDVWGRALDDIHVVGLSGTIGHFDGRRWTITPARARSDLLAVAGDDATVVAVGAAGAAFRHDGRRWAAEATGTAAGLRAVAVDADGGVFAAGDRGTILRRPPGEG